MVRSDYNDRIIIPVYSHSPATEEEETGETTSPPMMMEEEGTTMRKKTHRLPPSSSSRSSSNSSTPPSLQQQQQQQRTSRFRSLSQLGRPTWPEERNITDNIQCFNLALEYQKWTYSYMGTLLSKGGGTKKQGRRQDQDGTGTGTDTVVIVDGKRRLQQSDLYRVPRSMKSSMLVSKFEQHYNSQIAASASSSSSSSSLSSKDITTSTINNRQNNNSSKQQLMKTLWYLSKPTFIPGGFCQFIAVVCQVSMPLLVRQLLRILEDYPKQKIINIPGSGIGSGGGIPYAIGIFICLVVNAFANHRHRHLAMKTGIILRSTLVGIIYKRILQLTPQGKYGLSSGEVSTLVAIDTQKLFEVTQEAHLIWSMPLSMMLVMICLLLIMGPTTLVGLIVLLLFIPIVERIAAKIQSIRHQRVKVTDERVDIVNAMLQGIKVTKLNNYEEKYQQRIEATRHVEHSLLQRELAYWAISLLTTVISPMMASAATFTTFVLVNDNHILTAAKTFTVLLLFIALRFPISYFGRLIGRAAQAMEAIRRLEEFVNRPVRIIEEEEEQDHDNNEEETKESKNNPQSDGKATNSDSIAHDTETVLKVHNGSFRVGATRAVENDDVPESAAIGFEVGGLNFSVKRGQVLALIGPVASGKSTIINGIINEVPSLSGTEISMAGRVSYVGQTAFVLNATLRENILFGLDFEEEWYEKILDACCLRPDLEQLGEAGDLTEIGERGVTLSGGQKQRVSLARAAYARPDLILMDDPLSALDAGTAKKVFDRLIKSRTSEILSNSAIVLVTHASHFLNRVDLIMIVVDGKSQFTGTWEELSNFKPQDPKAKDAIAYIRSSVQEGAGEEDDHAWGRKQDNMNGTTDSTTEGGIKKTDGKLMTIEEREHGISSLRTWLLWFRHAGGIPFIVTMVFLMTCDRLVYVASEYWLARWTQGAYEPVKVLGIEFPAQTDGRSAQFEYLKVYAIIMCSGVFFTFLRSEWAVSGGVRCAKNVFLSMLSSVLLAPVSYFETTPLGRILNRFTYDMEVIDVTLTESMSILMIAAGWFITGIVVMVSILPWIAIALIPATTVYWFLLLHYRKCGTDLQRLDAVARSPIQAIVSEGLEGCTTIRIFQQVGTFVNVFYDVVDESSSALVNFVSAQRWLGLRIEVLGSSIVLISCLLVITMNDVLALEPGIVALLIIWCSNFTITLGFLVDYFAEGEAAITSIERVDAMVSIVHEKPMTNTTSNGLSSSWPDQGLLQFENVSLRYREGLPLALNKLSFTIPPGARCGVVGRTGAGKSSLTVALFRLVEIESGRILLDGVNLGSLGLADVRGRANGMAIIPQDPFIAGTTLREVLDPFHSAKDEQILEALVAVRLADTTSTLSVLDDPVAEGGSNFSVGERQLLNLARALLFKPKLLVLDEATASIDGETDAFIQKMLRTRFNDTTLVTVAHRLNTIMDYDVILVMDGGHAVEFGSPIDLLENNSIFTELVNSTGPESARVLHEIAMTSTIVSA